MANSIMNFIEENYHSLLWFAVRMTGNWADGEDVLQTVAAKICLKQDELKDIAHCKSYLMVCIRNATLNQRRTKARQRVADESYEKLKDTFSDPAIKQEYELVEWIESLDHHLEFYDEASRKAFIAYYVDQTPLEEVAASLGLTKRQTTKKFESMRNYLKHHHKHLFVQLNVLLSM
jgi:RNA polymerase sigma factor (sigma-70 family)